MTPTIKGLFARTEEMLRDRGGGKFGWVFCKKMEFGIQSRNVAFLLRNHLFLA